MLEIEKYTYGADAGSIRLFKDENTFINFCNESGDGEYDFYVVHASGWGPAHYKDKKEYENYQEFESSFSNLEYVCFLSDEDWKVARYDVTFDVAAELKSEIKFITVHRSGNTFVFFCYSGK